MDSLATPDPLHLKQPPFHGEAPLKPARPPVRPEGTVAGDDEGERVSRERAADRPGGAWAPDMPGDAPVGADIPPGDAVFGEEHTPLEGRAPLQVEEIDIEPHVISLKEQPDSGHQRPDALIPGFRNGEHLAVHRRIGPKVAGEDDPLDLRAGIGPHPDDADTAERRRDVGCRGDCTGLNVRGLMHDRM